MSPKINYRSPNGSYVFTDPADHQIVNWHGRLNQDALFEDEMGSSDEEAYERAEEERRMAQAREKVQVESTSSVNRSADGMSRLLSMVPIWKDLRQSVKLDISNSLTRLYPFSDQWTEVEKVQHRNALTGRLGLSEIERTEMKAYLDHANQMLAAEMRKVYDNVEEIHLAIVKGGRKLKMAEHRIDSNRYLTSFPRTLELDTWTEREASAGILYWASRGLDPDMLDPEWKQLLPQDIAKEIPDYWRSRERSLVLDEQYCAILQQSIQSPQPSPQPFTSTPSQQAKPNAPSQETHRLIGQKRPKKDQRRSTNPNPIVHPDKPLPSTEVAPQIESATPSKSSRSPLIARSQPNAQSPTLAEPIPPVFTLGGKTITDAEIQAHSRRAAETRADLHHAGRNAAATRGQPTIPAIRPPSGRFPPINVVGHAHPSTPVMRRQEEIVRSWAGNSP